MCTSGLNSNEDKTYLGEVWQRMKILLYVFAHE